MFDREMSPALPARGPAVTIGRAAPWLVAALALAVLAGCEHGQLSFDRNTGQFNVPIGQGSSK